MEPVGSHVSGVYFNRNLDCSKRFFNGRRRRDGHEQAPQQEYQGG